MRNSSSNKGFWVLILVLLAGLTVGGFIGSLCRNIPYLGWLDYGQTFGLEEPMKLDLGLLWISIQLVVKFTISGIIGMVLSVIVYRKF